MKYLQCGTLVCFFVVLLHCPVHTSGVGSQGLHEECPCWRKLAEELNKRVQTESDGRQADSLWLDGKIYDLIPSEDDDSLSSSSRQVTLNLPRMEQSLLGRLILRRAARSKPFRESRNRHVHCNVCWALFQDPPALVKEPRAKETYDFDFGGISKKAMLNNGW